MRYGQLTGRKRTKGEPSTSSWWQLSMCSVCCTSYGRGVLDLRLLDCAENLEGKMVELRRCSSTVYSGGKDAAAIATPCTGVVEYVREKTDLEISTAELRFRQQEEDETHPLEDDNE